MVTELSPKDSTPDEGCVPPGGLDGKELAHWNLIRTTWWPSASPEQVSGTVQQVQQAIKSNGSNEPSSPAKFNGSNESNGFNEWKLQKAFGA